MSVTTRTAPPLSALRAARAEAVAAQLARGDGRQTLKTLQESLMFDGMTRAEVDRAVDDLAAAGRVEIEAASYGLVVRLKDGEL